MNALRLSIHLHEPLLVTGVANGEENSSITLPYIPGSAIRGACVAAFLQKNKHISDLADDRTGRALFFANRVQFLHGYLARPLAPTDRSLPTPLSWMAKKDDLQGEHENRPVWDFSIELKKDKTRRKKEGRRFFWQNEKTPVLMGNPARQVMVHNASDDPMLKNETESNVFRYEALAAGQDFVAFIISDDEDLLTMIQNNLTKGSFYLGGSQTAGYGRVTFNTTLLTNWAGEADTIAHGQKTTITLLSDAILTDADGRPTLDFHTALGVALGRGDDVAFQCDAAFAGTQLVGGFNRKWGLGLPQSWAVKMGSVFVYDAAVLPASDLDTLLKTGIGKRRNEGFGRLGVNIHHQAIFETGQPDKKEIATVTLTDTSQRLAQQMANRHLRSRAERSIPKLLGNFTFPEKPENSQLSRLRLLVRKGLQAKDLGVIVDHLNGLQSAKVQFAERHLKIKKSKVSWDSWLRERVKQVDGFDLLGVVVADSEIAGISPKIDDQFKREITGLLIEAVVRKALKGKV